MKASPRKKVFSRVRKEIASLQPKFRLPAIRSLESISRRLCFETRIFICSSFIRHTQLQDTAFRYLENTRSASIYFPRTQYWTSGRDWKLKEGNQNARAKAGAAMMAKIIHELIFGLSSGSVDCLPIAGSTSKIRSENQAYHPGLAFHICTHSGSQ